LAETAPAAQVIRFATFEVNLRTGEIRKAGMKLKLGGVAFRVLAILLEQPGELVTRDELQKQLWPDTFVDIDHSLNAAINKIREVLGDSAESPRYVETVPRRGYRFIGSVTFNGIAPPVPESCTLNPLGAVPEWSPRRSAVRVVSILATVALLAIGAIWVYRNNVHVPKIQSLVVLPLENLSRDPEQEYFAEGITDELTAEIAKLSGLHVISRTSALHYRQTTKTLPQIAEELHVDAVIEGTVQRSGDRVRVIAQLIEARTDRHLWAESYERDVRDIFGLESEVASAIAHEIQLKLTPSEHARLTVESKINPEAHEAYLKGLYYWNKLTEEDVKKSIAYFEEAIRIQPRFAPAYAGLAFSYNLLGSNEYVAPADAFPKAKLLAQKALEIDPTLASAHAALGFAYESFDWNWRAAEAEYKRANELEPNGDGAHSEYALYLDAMGRHQEALAEMKKTIELDPLSILALWNLGALYWDMGQPEMAGTQYRKILEIEPNSPDGHQGLGITYALEKRYDLAIEELQTAVKLSPQDAWMNAWLGYAYAVAGKEKAAREVLHNLESLSKRKYVSAYLIATVYAGLGDRDRAFGSLETALEQRDCRMPYLKIDSLLASLRSDPRFGKMVRRTGLSES
jgi:TolB-like protein/DNA-binding winged helix-turn-helix (wHTH) protein/Tfp pilus assembly protein PilF